MAMAKIATVISSSGKTGYTISQDGTGWSCSCKGWTLHMPRRDCKHIRGCKRVSNGGVSNLDIRWIGFSVRLGKTTQEKARIDAEEAKEAAKIREAERVKRQKSRAKAKKREAEREAERKERESAAKEAEKKRLLKEDEEGEGTSTRFSLLELD